MPLPAPSPRQSLTTRGITTEGFIRDDGLLDIDGSVTDLRRFSATNPWRGTVPAGQPVHLIRLRITMNSDCVIQAVTGVTERAPYPLCQDALPSLRHLVGLVIGPGFNRRMQELVGNTAGCTHIITLLQLMAKEAMQTLASSRHQSGDENPLDAFPSREAGKPPLLNTCVAYAVGSPVVRVLYPDFSVASKDDSM